MTKIAGKEVGPLGFGLMGLTTHDPAIPDEQAFAAMRAALARGANFWNGGEFYGSPDANSLHLLNRYFTKYPEDADKVVLSIKGGVVPGTWKIDGGEENVRRSVEECLRVLDGKKKLDVFEMGRIDKNVPIETTVAAIAEFVKDGRIGGVGLSEIGPENLKRTAKALGGADKIVGLEVELSLFETGILYNGVAQTCAELGIPIIAYSPLCRGLLTGTIKSEDDVGGRLKQMFPRFQGDALKENIKLVQEIEVLAEQKKCKPSQLAIAWVRAMSGRKGLPTIIPIPGASSEGRVNENFAEGPTLTDHDMATIDQFLDRIEVKGGRYNEAFSTMLDE